MKEDKAEKLIQNVLGCRRGSKLKQSSERMSVKFDMETEEQEKASTQRHDRRLLQHRW